jgi:mono/diheme cytochrome c family protein
MEDQTIFYILGIGLTALALIVSFLGLRMEKFPPSRGALLGGIAVFALIVGGTTTYAWISAEEEQEHRDEQIAAGELPSPAQVMEEMAAGAAEAEAERGGGAPADETGGAGGTAGASVDAAAIFDEQGCAGCHALEAAGSTGAIGPDLDVTLKGTDAAFIEESIVDPEAAVSEGFPGGVMPDNFEELLTPEELDALVQYIAESVGAKS